MNAARRGLLGALFFAGIGVAVALSVAVTLGVARPQRASATHNPVISWLQQGLVIDVTCSPFKDDPDYGQYWVPNSHPCWHQDEPGPWTAMDYPAFGGRSTVYLYYFGDFQHIKIVALPYTTNCTGVAAALYDDYAGSESYRRGEVIYLHIDPAEGVVASYPSVFAWLGIVSSTQPNCAWTGPHLHQSADTSSSTPFYMNRYGVPWDEVNFFEHTIYWDPYPADADDDNDGYTDSNEIRVTTDPLDRCGDTTVAWDEEGFIHTYETISPWPPDFDDNRIVNIVDMFQVLSPFFGSSVYNPDLNGDGISEYTPRRDVQSDGYINILDVSALNPPVFGSTCTP